MQLQSFMHLIAEVPGSAPGIEQEGGKHAPCPKLLSKTNWLLACIVMVCVCQHMHCASAVETVTLSKKKKMVP